MNDFTKTQRFAFWFAVAIILVYTVTYSRPIRDGDYFWHLSTGKWIVEHQTLPTAEPFKFTYSTLEPGTHIFDHNKLFLRCYWLGDIFLYALYLLGGPGTVVLLRMAAYAGLLGWTLTRMRRNEAGLLGFVTAVAMGIMFTYLPNERPQLFAYLLFPAVLYLLDGLDGKTGRELKRQSALLCLALLVWANVHGSYILGIVLLGLYMAGLAVEVLLGRRPLRWADALPPLAAMLATLLNPNGWGLIADYLYHYGESGPAASYEGLSVISLLVLGFKSGSLRSVYLPFWVCLVTVAIVLLVRIRTMKPWHLLVAVAVGVMSISALRHMIYIFLLLPLLAPYFSRLVPMNIVGTVVVVLMVVFGYKVIDSRNMLTIDEDRRFPKKAVAFMAQVPTQGNLFNFYDWGGYVPLHLTGQTTFIDGRTLVPKVQWDYEAVIAGTGWDRILAFYDVNTVLIPGFSAHNGSLNPVIVQLAQSPGWALIYWDDASTIFVRRTPANREVIEKYGRPSSDVKKHLDAMSEWVR